jgi:hypothetical protein
LVAAEDVQALDLGRSTQGGGVHQFKSRWGGHDETPCCRRYLCGNKAPGPSRGMERFRHGETSLQRAWKRQPLWCANRLGSLLRRDLPFL